MVERAQILDHGYLQIVDSWGSDECIIEAARMSTGKGFTGWGTEDTCNECGGTGNRTRQGFGPGSICAACVGRGKRVNTPGDEKLLRFLWENKHHTPFEMAGATFEVQAPIFVFREWHRHRVPFSYNEMSARYTPLPDVNYIPSMGRLMLGSDGKNRQAGTIPGAAALTMDDAHAFQSSLSAVYEAAETLYQHALKVGVPKELARVCLPVGRYSRMRASANLRGWVNFLMLRDAPSAQWEIRSYAGVLANVLREKFPRTMALYDERGTK